MNMDNGGGGVDEMGFNEAELKQLVQYLESPVIKRYNQLGPELQNILGGQTRRIRMAKTGPTVIMLAGLQGAGHSGGVVKLIVSVKRAHAVNFVSIQRNNGQLDTHKQKKESGIKQLYSFPPDTAAEQDKKYIPDAATGLPGEGVVTGVAADVQRGQHLLLEEEVGPGGVVVAVARLAGDGLHAVI